MRYNLSPHRTVETSGDDLLVRLDDNPTFQLTRAELITLARIARESQVDQHFTDVETFQRLLCNNYEGGPRVPETELRSFRLRFLGEELIELGEALGFKITVKIAVSDEPVNLADALDGLVDLDYVLKGTVLQLGFGRVYQEAWRRVHAANMRKIPGTTKRGYGKDAIKPPDWRAPDLSDLVLESVT